MAEAGEAQEVVKKEIETASHKFLEGVTDVQDSLYSVMADIPGVGKAESAAFDVAAASLRSFLESDPKLITANPRSIREEDRATLYPGQHAGVYLQFGLDDGTVLRMNVWGGLRNIAGSDYRDTVAAGAKQASHTERTHRVISKPTQINWQIAVPGDNGPTIDSWIVFNPGRENSDENFHQSRLRIEEERIDAIPRFNKDGYKFDEIKETIFTSVRELTNRIPSSV